MWRDPTPAQGGRAGARVGGTGAPHPPRAARKLTPLAWVVTGVLLLACGVVHGLWTDRWQKSPEVDEFVARLQNVPKNVGDWRGTDLELTAEELRAARIDGYCLRRYENVRNRHTVTVLLVCGRSGPISVHTPDVCFVGSGYKALTDPAPFDLAYGADRKAGFRTMRMAKDQETVPTEIRVFWAWNAAGAWQAPEQPRFTFARHRALYKLYVLRETSTEAVRPEADPCVRLMEDLLPQLDAALFDAPTQ